jgi:hypothetical protein
MQELAGDSVKRQARASCGHTWCISVMRAFAPIRGRGYPARISNIQSRRDTFFCFYPTVALSSHLC